MYYRLNYPITVKGAHIFRDGVAIGAAGSQNSTCLTATFDEDWDGLSKTIFWYDATDHTQQIAQTVLAPSFAVDEDMRVYTVPVPTAAMSEAGTVAMVIEGSEVVDSVTSAVLTTEYGYFRILPSSNNIVDISEDDDPLSILQQVLNLVNEAVAFRTAAANSAQDASDSADAAAESETNAAAYASSAQTSATAAAGSASDASDYATAASGSASDASDYATAAAGSAGDASDYATAAAGSASDAADSASAASDSATAAAGSASDADDSATAAAGSATEAAGYADDAEEAAEAAIAAAQSIPVLVEYITAAEVDAICV
jgi:hypothetical protein